MKTKANAGGINFHWQDFESFWEDLLKVVPEDYHPDRYRLKFDLTAADGYTPTNFSVNRLRRASEERQRVKKREPRNVYGHVPGYEDGIYNAQDKAAEIAWKLDEGEQDMGSFF